MKIERIKPVPLSPAQLALQRAVDWIDEELTGLSEARVTPQGIWARAALANRELDMRFAFQLVLEHPTWSKPLHTLEEIWAGMGLPSPWAAETEALDIVATARNARGSK